MTKLEKLKLLLGISNTSKDSLLTLLLQQAEDEAQQYCNRTTLPTTADNIIVDMATVKYNLLGVEGIASQSFSGSSETIANYPPQLIKSLNRYRKVKLI